MTDETFEDGFDILKKDFKIKLKNKINELNIAEEKMFENEEALRSLYKIIHNISGTCGMFGFHQISMSADELEESLKPFVKEKIKLNAENTVKITELLNSLKANLNEEI